MFLFAIVLTWAQAPDTSFHLLWYKGKKITANSLKMPSGDTIVYNPSKGTIKVSAARGSKSSVLDEMNAECNRSEKRMQQMLTFISSRVPKPALPSISIWLKKAYANVKDQFTGVLVNTIVLPAEKLSSEPKAKSSGPDHEGYEFEDPVDIAVSELEEWLKDHKSEKITWVPVPPRKEFNYCDFLSDASEKKFKQEMNEFLRQLAGEDKDILQKAFSTSRSAHFLKSESEAVAINNRITPVIDLVLDRMHARAQIVIDKYLDDPYRAASVVQVMLMTDRQEQLLGYETTFSSEVLKHAFDATVQILQKAMDERDYSIALNMKLIFMAERQFEILASQSIPNGLFDKLLKFNQFKLSFDVSAKVSGDGAYQLAAAKAENWFMAIQDTTGMLQWFLVGPNVNKMKIALTASEMRGNGAEIDYVGTKKWMDNVPKMRISFCGGHPDSVEVYQFFPEEFKELWSIPKVGIQNLLLTNNVLMNCFLDVDQVKQDAAKYQNPAQAEKLKKELMRQYASMSNNNLLNTIKNDGGFNIGDLGNWAEFQTMSRKFSNTLLEVNPGKYLFTPVVHNRDPLLIDAKINGKELFPQNTSTVYAWFYLKLQHDPDGPYSFNMNGYYFSGAFL
jgi:hypothetical protein